MGRLGVDEQRVVYAHNTIMRYCSDRFKSGLRCRDCPLQNPDGRDVCYNVGFIPRLWSEQFLNE